jgi:hypothetical protein
MLKIQPRSRVCAMRNEDCSGSLERDHVGYNSVTHEEVIQTLCHYHNCGEAREYRFFVANQVLGGRALPGPLRLRLNEWHVRHGLHPKFKIRIHALAEANPLPEGFVPGQGQVRADKAIAEGRSVKFRIAPYLYNGKILGFRFALTGDKPKLVK